MRKLLSTLFTLLLLIASFQMQANPTDNSLDQDRCATQILAKRSTLGVILQADTKGNAPFVFSWSTGEDTQRILAKKPGKYCVKVEDADGCVSKACFEVKGDTGNDKCKTEISVQRSGSGAKLTANTKGEAPFKYHWSNGETTQSVKAVKPGKYCVKVEDANGCTSGDCFEIKGDTGNDKCTTVISPSRIDKNGAVKLTAHTRGKAPFKYSWSNGETTQTILAKKPGKYCVKVIDANDCVSSACFEVKDRDSGGDKCKTIIRMRRSSKGTKLVARTKGRAPFKYSWSNGETTQSIIVTKSGKYCVKVEDANGCVSDACFEVKIRDRGDDKCKTIIQEQRTPTQVRGRKLTARTKGKAPFKYSWSNGETTQSILAKKPGKYCVKVEDANGCVSSACIVVKDRNPNNDRCKTTITAFKSDIRRGAIKLFARTAGKAPFEYHWSTGESTQSILVKKPGKYCVKVKDAKGCVSSACFEVKDDTGGDRCKTEIRTERTRDRQVIILTANTKGKAPFKYEWVNGATTKSIKVKEYGKYCVTVKDADGCVSRACFEYKKGGRLIGDDPSIQSDAINTRENNNDLELSILNVYPNPFMDKISLEIESNKNQKINYSFFNISGQNILNNQIQINKGINKILIDANSLISGQYILNIVTEKGVQNIKIEKN